MQAKRGDILAAKAAACGVSANNDTGGRSFDCGDRSYNYGDKATTPRRHQELRQLEAQWHQQKKNAKTNIKG